MTKRFYHCMGLSLSAALLAACTSGILKNSEDSVKTTEQKQGATKNLAKDEEQIVRSKPGIYYDTTPVKLQNDPAWMQNTVRLRGNALPFSFYVDQLVKGTPAQVRYQTEVNRNALIDFSYSGTVKGALDALSNRQGLAYEVDDNAILWKAFITQTFNISFMPGTSKYSLGGDANEAKDQDSQNSSQSNLVTMGATNIADSQYTNLSGDVSVWKDLKETLAGLLSGKDATAIVSESTTTVTVRDHPENVRTIAKYLTKLNKEMSQQVALNVQVLSINLNDGFRFGIDWDYLNGKYSFGGQYSQPIELQPLGSVSTSAVSGGSGGTGVGLSIMHGNPRFLIDALGQMGKVSTVTEPRVVTLNNQVAQIRISKQTSYLAEVSQTITQTGATTSGSVGGATETLTPGVVTTGFSIYLLPKIKNKNVYLQITSSLSTLVGTPSVSSQSSGSSDSPPAGSMQIQVPIVDAQNFNQRALVPSGNTLLLTGFKQVQDTVNKAGPFGIIAAGGQGAQKQNIETVILITPSILKAEG